MEKAPPRKSTKGYKARRRILKTALVMMAEKGPDGVSMREISARLKITKPGLYYHFKNKAELVKAAFMEGVKHFEDFHAEISRPGLTLEARLERIFTRHLDFIKRYPDMPKCALKIMASPSSGVLSSLARELKQRSRGTLRKMLSKEKLPENGADNILHMVSAIMGYFMIEARENGAKRLDRDLPGRLARLICSGARHMRVLAAALLLSSVAGQAAPAMAPAAAPAAAQESMPETGVRVSSQADKTWTMENCLSRALQTNPSMQSAREGLKATKGYNQMALSEFVPRVNWNTVYIKNDKTLMGSLAAAIPGLRPSMSSEDYYLSSFSADQILFSWRMAPLRRAMKANTKLAALKLAAAENDTTLNVKKAFYISLYAKQLLVISQAAEAVARENLETSQALYKEGKVSTFDVSRASVRRVNAKTAAISARNALTVSLEALRMLLSLPAGETFDIDGDFSETPKDAALADEINSALARRPDLGQARAAENLQSAAKELALTGFLPTVFAGFTYAWEGRDFAPGSGNDYKSWTAKAGISIPLFDGMFSIGRFKAQKAGLAQAKEQSRAAADGVIMEVRQYYYSLASSRESLQAQKENVETAAENLRIAQERYKLGLLSLLDLKDAELSNIEARTQQVKALYDYNIAFALLERATGLPAAASN